MAAFVKTLSLLSDMNDPGTGALFEIAGGVNLKLSKIAVSVNNFTAAGATPLIDVTNIGMGNVGGRTGVSLTSESNVDPSSAYIPARDIISDAITTIGLNNLENIMCGALGCSTSEGAITTADQLANAIIDAMAATVTVEEVLSAATVMAEYAAEVAPIIDEVVTDGGDDYTSNTSNLTVEGASFTEIAFGMAKPFLIDGLLVGGNLKMVNGRVGYATFNFLAEESGKTDAFDDFSDNMETSWKPALDLGFLMELNKKWTSLPMNPRLGLVIRNINNPKFDKPVTAVAARKGSEYTLDRQARMGLAISPANFWHLAMDMDLTKNDTPIDGFKSRQLSLGTEINIFNKPAINIPLRAGIMKNLAESDSKMSYTAGLGINLIHLHIDLGGVMSSDTSKIDNEDVPNKFAFSGSLALLF
ncbi:MAG: conjugal transfer protein TraF, partial [Elusimicrobia bacterium]|nr:conjugal transfer protein TraF [Elusimicrobiota bacterium]